MNRLRALVARVRAIEAPTTPIAPMAVLFLPSNGRDVEDAEHEMQGSSGHAVIELFEPEHRHLEPEETGAPAADGEPSDTTEPPRRLQDGIGARRSPTATIE
jgi:hypothetical protein